MKQANAQQIEPTAVKKKEIITIREEFNGLRTQKRMKKKSMKPREPRFFQKTNKTYKSLSRL